MIVSALTGTTLAMHWPIDLESLRAVLLRVALERQVAVLYTKVLFVHHAS